MPQERTLPSLTLISASAGSGKTRALTNEFLSLWLSDRVPHSNLRNILAITFTHNAANEMKRRVMESLKHIVLRDEESEELLAQLSTGVGISAEALVDLSRLKLEELFDSYGVLQVLTIDSFVVDIFRTMALEMGFPPGVEIEIESDTLLERAFEEFLRETAIDTTQKILLRDVVALAQQARRNSSRYLWDPFKYIVGETTALRGRLRSIAKPLRHEFSHADADRLRASIYATVSELQARLEKSKLSVNKLFQNDLGDLLEGDIESVLERTIKEKFFNATRNTEERKLADRLQPLIENDTRRLYGLLSEYTLHRSRAILLPWLRMLDALDRRLQSIARREGLLTLDEISRALSRSVSRNAVPEIYFKLGETLHHFLVDEFQDTSPLQWTILKPLFEETLAGEGSLLVVGDTKQSIYSFRGADWRIMRSVEKGAEFSSVVPDVKSLDSNYRSDGVLVNYVRELFSTRIRSSEVGEAASLSGLSTYAQESIPERKTSGYVSVEFVERDPEGNPERKRLLDILTDCRSRNVSLASIGVLAPRNKDILEISSWLNEFNASQAEVENQFPFVAHSGLDIRRRAVIRELIALLSFLDVPIDDLSFATVILGEMFSRVCSAAGSGLSAKEVRQFLHASRIGSGRTVPLYRLFERQFPHEWQGYFQSLFTRVGYLPLYDLATESLKTFHLFETYPEEQASLVRFLEIIAAAESDGASVLKEFLAEAEGESSGDERWQLPVPELANALRLMTIHKSKGLGFDTVILLMHDESAVVRGAVVDDSGDEAILFSAMNEKIRSKNQELTERYQRQLLFAQTDWLNTLYVALTRAQHELRVVVIRKEEKPKVLSRVLAETSVGVKATREFAPKEPPKRAAVYVSAAHRAYEVTSAKLPGLLETRRGEAMHAALSKIYFIDTSAEAAARDAAASLTGAERGMLSAEEIESTLVPFLSQETIRALFEQKLGRAVLNEREFVNADGELFRCDRVMEDPETVTVVDFKTGSGERESEYRQQLRNYKRILAEIYAPKSIRGLLAYVDLKKIVEVEE
jgi:ATP-dependent exoDNAse (exonuclease V) beta subunit